MIAKTIKGNSTEEISFALNEALADGPISHFKPTLAIVFLSVKQNIAAITKLLDEQGIQVFGATTAGEFIDGEMEAGSVVMLLLDMEPAYFKIAFLDLSPQTAFEDGKKLSIYGNETFSNPAFIIANSGVSLAGDPLIEGMIQGSGKYSDREVNIFGGKAGDDLALEATFVFTNGKNKDSAIVALIIDQDKIDVKGIATCGWKAIGTAKTITRSEANIVYTIDDKPALDMLINFLGVEIKTDGNREVVTFLNSWYYPLQLERENVDPVIRTAMFANQQDRSLLCSGNVPQGSKVRFSMPPDFDSIDTVVAECKAFQENTQPDADALIMFSCVSRHLSFGMVMKEEIEQVQEIWRAPMAGFFSYGEYGKPLSAPHTGQPGKYDYHNNTCCLVVLKEK